MAHLIPVVGTTGLNTTLDTREPVFHREDALFFVPFHDHFPELAERETRTITVFDQSSFDLPPGDYGLVEMFCDEPDCDCRRVMFLVVSSRKKAVEAVISYGWEDLEFYAKWLRINNPAMVEELRGPSLNPGSPHSELAPAILRLIEEVILPDTAYIERVKAHYRIFRRKIDKTTTSPQGPKKRKQRRKK